MFPGFQRVCDGGCEVSLSGRRATRNIHTVGPIPPQTLCRLSVSRRPGYQGVGFALSVPTPQGWLRSREDNAKSCGYSIARPPISASPPCPTASWSRLRRDRPASLRTRGYALELGSAYWPDGTQVTRKPSLMRRLDGGRPLRLADRQRSAEKPQPPPRPTRYEPD